VEVGRRMKGGHDKNTGIFATTETVRGVRGEARGAGWGRPELGGRQPTTTNILQNAATIFIPPQLLPKLFVIVLLFIPTPTDMFVYLAGDCLGGVEGPKHESPLSYRGDKTD